MSANTKRTMLRSPNTAPKDRVFLADFGYPWLLPAIWNGHSEQWATVTLQACEMRDGTIDRYYEQEYEAESDLRGWVEMPKVHRKKKKP